MPLDGHHAPELEDDRNGVLSVQIPRKPLSQAPSRSLVAATLRRVAIVVWTPWLQLFSSSTSRARYGPMV